jgi:aldehyde dehydrogenase (NAD+)
VVVKPSERAPRTQQRLLELAVAAGLPRGVLEWTPATREAGAALLTRQFDHVVFTGSTAVGREIAMALAPTLTPCTLELSGRDSALVMEDADGAKAARAIWGAVTINHGQTCMGPRRALVHERVYREFVETLRGLAANAPRRRLIDEKAAASFETLVSAAIKDGGQDAAGSGATPLREHDVVRAAAVVDCPAMASLVEGKHFAPALAVVPVPTLAYALAIHRRCDQHLTASIYTRDIAAARALAPELGATNVTINDSILATAHPGVSIGGRGESGWGLSRGPEGLLAMTRPVYVSSGKHGVERVLTAPGPRLTSLVAWVLTGLGGAARAKRLPAAGSGRAARDAE